MPNRPRDSVEGIAGRSALATDHNLLIVQPGALEEVGMAANEMAKDPKNANFDFIPEEKRSLIIEASPQASVSNFLVATREHKW